jgi:hypothetical protein
MTLLTGKEGVPVLDCSRPSLKIGFEVQKHLLMGDIMVCNVRLWPIDLYRDRQSWPANPGGTSSLPVLP